VLSGDVFARRILNGDDLALLCAEFIGEHAAIEECFQFFYAAVTFLFGSKG